MKLRAGTRKSPLAMAQTYMVLDMIKAAFPECDTEIVTFTTKGDRQLDRPLDKIGGKGVFVTEIEQALQSGEIDFAVHSAKDLPVTLGEGLEISGVCPRGNYRDMLVTKKGVVFNDSDVFTVGTGSQRRRGGFARLYPNAKFADIRGNVGTRLKKLSDGLYDGIILCAAGTERLGLSLSEYDVKEFEPWELLPAPCQAIIAVECAKESKAAEVISQVSHKETMLRFETEREVIRLLGADCTVPVGAYSEINGEKISLTVSDGKGRFAQGEKEIEKRFELVKELTDKLNFFKCLINRNSAYRYGTIADNPFTCFMDVFSCGKIHQRVSTPFTAPQCFLHFFINAGGSSRISDVRIDFYKEVTSDNHRFSFRVVDVGR